MVSTNITDSIDKSTDSVLSAVKRLQSADYKQTNRSSRGVHAAVNVNAG
jgi:hypothetical protein